jgi:predicted aconitase with swiveling domain
VSEGLALVTRDRISGWGGIDSRTGTIVETRHELRGVSFAGRVLVFLWASRRPRCFSMK